MQLCCPSFCSFWAVFFIYSNPDMCFISLSHMVTVCTIHSVWYPDMSEIHYDLRQLGEIYLFTVSHCAIHAWLCLEKKFVSDEKIVSKSCQ